MSFLRRLFGRCRSPMLEDHGAWRFADGALELDVSAVPALAPVGSAVRLEGGELPARVVVVHGIDGKWYAYENRCTHMGRRIDPLTDAPYVQCCSVGKSTWDYEGRRISGSATHDLTRFPLQRAGDTLRIVLTA